MKSEGALENNEGYLLLFLSGALLSADLQRLTNEVLQSRAMSQIKSVPMICPP